MTRFGSVLPAVAVLLTLLPAPGCKEETPAPPKLEQAAPADVPKAAPAAAVERPTRDVAKDQGRELTIAWTDAADFIGQDVRVVGKVARTYKSGPGNVFLNFTQDWKGTLSIYIPRAALANFAPAPGKQSTKSPEAKLEELKSMYDKDVITKSEYDQKRKQILDQM